jgi:hypothetical protein
MPSLILEALLTAPSLYINQLQFSQHSLGVRGVRALLRGLETNATVKHASFGDAMGERVYWDSDEEDEANRDEEAYLWGMNYDVEDHEWVQALALSCTLMK